MPKAIITGITGQDGSYLAELLLSKGYKVYGIIRPQSSNDIGNVRHLEDEIELKFADLTDSSSLVKVFSQVKPDEIYNLGAQTNVATSFELPEYTAQCNAVGTLNVLESVRSLQLQSRIYHASTSELYGEVKETPQTEETPFNPASPYGVAKLYAHYIVKNYREAYGIHASCGIGFNHESPRRGEHFVTRKITKGLHNIYKGKQKELRLGNIYSKRDWGHAKDVVRGMWLILQQTDPNDYILATGVQHSIKEFIAEASKYFGMDIEWQGTGLDEVGIDKNSGKTIVKIDEKYFRPVDVTTLEGDYNKIKNSIGWEPEISFEELVKDMCENEK